jgi:hypothetical protein
MLISTQETVWRAGDSLWLYYRQFLCRRNRKHMTVDSRAFVDLDVMLKASFGAP